MKLKKRIISIILIVLLMITTVQITVLADYVRITDRNPDYEYFSYYSSGWKALLTPKHLVRDSNPEIVAYCLEHASDRPNSTYYNSTNTPFSYFSARTLKGLLIILEYGYPYNKPSNLNADQARYATANAIRFWLSEEGVPNQYSFTNLSNVDLDALAETGWVSNSYIKSNSNPGSLKTLQYAIELLKLARAQERMPHEVTFSPSTVSFIKKGDNYVGTTQVTLANLKGGYTLNQTNLPLGSSVTGYTGNSGDNLTITIPISAVTSVDNITITASGSDNRVPSNLYWSVSASDPDKQDLVYMGTSFMPVSVGTLGLDIPNNGFIEIYKTDDDTGELLSNAIYQILDSAGNEADRLTTDENGYDISVELPAGTYSIQEVTAPYGYVLDMTVYQDIVVTADNTTTVDLTDRKQTGAIIVNKRDIDTGNIPQGDASLNGAVFEIYQLADDFDDTTVTPETIISEGAFIERVECGDNDYAETSQLQLGKYGIIEIEAPEGYLINEEAQVVNIEYANQTVEVNRVNIDFTDTVIKGNIAITKIVDEPLAEWSSDGSDNPLQGVEFEIKLKSTDELIEILILDENGYAESAMYPYGIYTITETIPPVGYSACTPFDIEINENNKTYEIEIENKAIRSQVQIIKTDIDTGEVIPIAGAQFQILDINNQPVILDGMDIFTTNETGIIELNDSLIYGSYTLHEIASPYGYWLNDTPISFVVDETTEGDVIILEFADEHILKRIQINKTDASDNSVKLQGAIFEVYKDDVLIDTLTTDSNGEAITIYLPVGEYHIVEVQAPTGYVLGNNSFNITIGDDEINIYTISCTNRQTELTITKTDIIDGTPLQNANFCIYDDNGRLVVDNSTNEDGELTIRKLPVGTYTFIETIAPIGYVLDESIYTFTISENGTITGTTDIQNQPTSVTLSKLNLTNGDGLPNAQIEIYNINGETVFSGITDENGEITVTHLPVGTYAFKEITAPDGFILSEDVFQFSIDEYGVATGITEMSNCPTMLKILKVKYSDNTPLTGAGFKVKNWTGLETLTFIQNDDGTFRYDIEGDITEILVDENGEAVIYGIPFGDYWLEESTIPSGYYPTAPVRVSISDVNDIENPYEAIVPNSVFVKLGLDRDKYNVVIAIVLSIIIIGGLVIKQFRKEIIVLFNKIKRIGRKEKNE
ncbi:MAG: SpaA isopeptide-forming pilin-related protein [Eubacteriales bacterium]